MPAQVLFVVFVQFCAAYMVREWAWWQVLVASYVVSGTANQNLFCAQHEISHCLAFRRPLHNKILALVGNMPLVVPVAVKFREYHHDHHIFMGVDGGDVDLPTALEAHWITSVAAKAVYGFFYLAVYGVRPLMVRPKPANAGDAVNWLVVMASNALVLRFWGIKSLFYLFAGSILGGGLHPLAGHLLAEHYMFEAGQETYSYYGPLNALSYNVGFHNEHHDFPQIPQTRLHRLRAIAPEFYDDLRHHTSWTWVIFKFLTDPTVGPWSRMHRPSREGSPAGNQQFVDSTCAYGARLVPSAAAAATDAAAAAEGGRPAAVLVSRQRGGLGAAGGNKPATPKHARADSCVENDAPVAAAH
jgi:sphingolipid delta-4 desaturase